MAVVTVLGGHGNSCGKRNGQRITESEGKERNESRVSGSSEREREGEREDREGT